MVKQRKKAILISVMLAIILLILIVLIRLYLISSAKITCSQIAQDICSDQVTWREHITYEMLSEDIQAVVSQEEFESNSDDIAFGIYKKLENTSLCDKKNFPGSTAYWKTDPLPDIIVIEGKKYEVDFIIDFDVNCQAFIPHPEVVNFNCSIKEI